MAVPHFTITVWLHNWYLKDSILWYPKEIMEHHVVVLFTAGQ